jgi:hypothetical protein
MPRRFRLRAYVKAVRLSIWLTLAAMTLADEIKLRLAYW